jgi:protein-L-isoaspartate(D-aspartate) O-methyltransferase
MSPFRVRRSRDLAAMSSREREEEFAARRHEMVRTQIERREIRDPAVLEAMRTVPRHLFMPERLWGEAYHDCPLPIGHEQTISQPYIVALMTELLGVGQGDRVLEVGAGSGYQAAVLAELGCEVISMEIVEALAESAERTLRELGYDNVRVVHVDGSLGYPAAAPYDGIIGTAAPAHLPPGLLDQLKEGARLVLPIGEFEQNLYVYENTSLGVEKRTVIPVRFVPMTGQAQV